jgi:hypothetical protein
MDAGPIWRQARGQPFQNPPPSGTFALEPMRTHYIIDSAATLLGVSLVIVTAVHISGKSATSIADELSFVAALLFLGACAASHLAIVRSNDRFERIADRIFAAGLIMLLFAALSFWF